MLFLIISKYNIFFCGGQTPCGGGGSPFAPLVYIFSTKKFGFVWGRGYISPPLHPTHYSYICHIPYLYISIFGYVCHTCSSYLSHLTPFAYLISLPYSPITLFIYLFHLPNLPTSTLLSDWLIPYCPILSLIHLAPFIKLSYSTLL
jgi:hypothetical protein